MKRARSGSGRAPFSLELAATAATWAIYWVCLQWARGLRTLTADKLVRQVLPMMDALVRTGNKSAD